MELTIDRPSVEYFNFRGPHDVVVGETDALGIPGIVIAPETGPRCPAVIVGHGYLQPVHRYTYLLSFLASWGFVAAAPATERGPVPSYAGLALDMTRLANRLPAAKLHRGRVTVDPRRIGFSGHGTGGGAAVLAAAATAGQAVITIFPAPVTPSAVAAAGSVTAPSLHIAAGSDRLGTDAEKLAAAWGGDAQLRRIKGADHLGATEGSHLTSTLLGQKGSAAVRRTIQILVTTFAMYHLAGHDQIDLTGRIAGTRPVVLTN